MDRYLLLIAIGLNLVVLIFDHLIKPYFTEKGKNLATKEDISEITDKIEEVKSQYSRELEATKADLQSAVERNNLLLQKSTEILLAFYDDIVILFHDKITRLFSDFTDRDLDIRMSNHLEETELLFRRVSLNYHRLLIFSHKDEDIKKHALQLLINTLKMRDVFRYHIGARTEAARSEFLLSQTENVSSYQDAVSLNESITKAYFSDLEPFSNDMDELLKAFIAMLADHLQSRNFESVNTTK